MMKAHLALSCHKVPHNIKEKFLLIVKTHGDNQLEAEKIPSKKRKVGHQQSITKYANQIQLNHSKSKVVIVVTGWNLTIYKE